METLSSGDIRIRYDKVYINRMVYIDTKLITIASGNVNPEDSTFHIILHLNTPTDVQLLSSDIFITPGDSVFIELNGLGLITAASGDNAGHYLISTTLGEHKRPDISAFTGDPERVRSMFDDDFRLRMALIEEAGLTPECKSFFEGREQFRYRTSVLQYYRNQKDALGLTSQFLKGIPVDTLPLFNTSAIPRWYWSFLQDVFNYHNRSFETSGDMRKYTDSLLSAFPESYSDPLMMTFLRSQFYLRKREPRLRPVIDDFYRNYAESKIKDSLVKATTNDAYNAFSAHSAKLPDYVLNQKLLDPSGNELLFKDILEANKGSGKGIYLDFWASWCGPCIAEIEVSKTVSWDNIPLQKVYVSVDDDKNKWVAASRKHNILSRQYLLTKESQDPGSNAFLYYFFGENISLPRYAIISKDGKLFSSSAPRPSAYERLKKITSSL